MWKSLSSTFFFSIFATWGKKNETKPCVRHYRAVSASAFFNARHWGLLRTVIPLSCCWAAALTAASAHYASLQGASFLKRSLCSVSYVILTLEMNALGKASFPIAIYSSSLYTHCRAKGSVTRRCLLGLKPKTCVTVPAWFVVWKVWFIWRSAEQSRCRSKLCTWQRAVPGHCQSSRRT